MAAPLSPPPNLSLLYSSNTSQPTSSLTLHSPLSLSPLSAALSLSFKPKRAASFLASAIVEQDNAVVSEERFKRELTKPGELYVCNLTRGCDISDLLDLFTPYGTVHSVEISRDSKTGVSRGCGYIAMSSAPEAKAAIKALDGSDLGGREIRVKFSADMVPGRNNTEVFNSTPKLGFIYESPYKAYVGNLSWSIKPEHLREHFSQFGTIASARVLYDRKGGKNRVYGFLSFSSADELKAAIGANGSEFHGRTLLVREGFSREAVL